MANFQLVEESSLFDRDWYLNTYPDVDRAGIDPLLHFMDLGWREGRDPGPRFATSAYLRANADVARSGMNPLVHFIEFGHSEGRETVGHRAPADARAAVSYDFDSPAKVASFALPLESAVAWRRSYRLDRNHRTVVTIGDWPVGYTTEEEIRATFKAATELVDYLSAVGDQSPAPKSKLNTESGSRLRDAWYLNLRQLRLRWQFDGRPYVVRIFQHCASQPNGLALVGEGLVSSEINAIDAHLKNAFFPLLLAFAEPEGELLDARLMPFPSLCRGGVHYPELLHWTAVNRLEAVEPLRAGDYLASRLIELKSGAAEPAVRAIAVDLEGGAGTGVLFNQDFKQWLAQVAQIEVAPLASNDFGASARYLAEAVATAPMESSRRGGATMTIDHDMVPTIGALTEPRGRDGDRQIFFPPLLIADEPAQPCIVIEWPPHLPRSFRGSRSSVRAHRPRLDRGYEGAANAFPPAAIRSTNGRTLTEPELFRPVADSAPLAAEQRPPITWLVETAGWEPQQLEDSIYTAEAQEESSADVLILVGSREPLSRLSARKHFRGRLGTASNMRAAIGQLSTPLVAYLGSGVVLHDNRTVALLAELLNDHCVTTASCVLLAVEKRGKAWRAVIADGGAFATGDRPRLTVADHSRAAEQLWRSNYLVAYPCPKLWIARSTCVAGWIDTTEHEQATQVVHACSSMVTASCVDDSLGKLPDFVPSSPADSITRVGTLSK